MKYIASIYPNREIRVVRCPERRPCDESPQGFFDSKSPPEALAQDSEAEPEDDGGRPEATPSPLTLHPNSEPRAKPGYGAMGRETRFGTSARRSLLRCGGVFDLEKVAPSEVLFLTGTLPGGTMDAMIAMASWSSCLVDRLKSWISKYAKTTYSLYVWERQRRGALHLHYAVCIPDPVARHRVLAGFKSWWTAALNRVGSDADVDMFAWANGRGTWRDRPEVVQADAQVCRKSPSRYLAKYASKGVGKEKGGVDSEGVVMPWPVRWWGCSRPLLAACRKYTETVVVQGCSHAKSKEWDEKIYEKFAQIFANARERYTLDSGPKDADSEEASESTWHSYRDKAGSSRVWVGFGPQFRDAWNQVVPILRKDLSYAEAMDRHERAGLGELRQPATSDERDNHDNRAMDSNARGNTVMGARKPAKRSPLPGQMSIERLGEGDGSIAPGPPRLRSPLRSTRLRIDDARQPDAGSERLGDRQLLYLGVYWEVRGGPSICSVPFPRQFLEAERERGRTRWAWCRMAASRH